MNSLIVLQEPTRSHHSFQHQPKGQRHDVQLDPSKLYQTNLLQVMSTIFCCFTFWTREQKLRLQHSTLSLILCSFRATVAQQRAVYWINVKSDALLRGGYSEGHDPKTERQNVPDSFETPPQRKQVSAWPQVQVREWLRRCLCWSRSCVSWCQMCFNVKRKEIIFPCRLLKQTCRMLEDL